MSEYKRQVADVYRGVTYNYRLSDDGDVAHWATLPDGSYVPLPYDSILPMLQQMFETICNCGFQPYVDSVVVDNGELITCSRRWLPTDAA